eukprot:TRINITY_DN13532_c0_g1_i1.p1 TRINITY_DN13532_c0_g1~~TRINITY_DN13532_c0_g1_i1.p1  ORF type:complete len:257 (+),score=81.94 TRINITY_DN13532_c0_g1_i1:50-820(+)
MSSFKKLIKTRTYKERAQPKERSRLGILEKKKDYVQRARNYQQKQLVLQKLREKAALRNPEEFHHAMINAETQDGVSVDLKRVKKKRTHKMTKSGKKVPLETVALHHDANYIMLQKTKEDKKVEKMKEELHFAAAASESSERKHTIFVEDDEEAATFDPAKHFDTHPSLLNRAFNRPRLSDLENQPIVGGVLDTDAALSTRKLYREFAAHVQQNEKLNEISQELQQKKNLKSKDPAVKVKTKDGEKITKWKTQRKK